MLLFDGEQVLQQEDAHSLLHSHRGSLMLTNYRVVFEKHSAGLFQAGSSQTVFEIGLEQVHNVHVNSPLIKLPFIGQDVLTLETSAGRFEFSVSNPRAWQQHFAQVRSRFRPQAFSRTLPPPPPPPPPSPVVVNVMAPPSQMLPPPPPPPPQVMFRCRHCNTVYPEMAGRCPSCGAPF